MFKVIFGIALTCMLLQLGESQSNCKIGNCGCNKKTINVNKPGLPVRNLDVCCPPSGSVTCSKYLRAGDATADKKAFCNCDYTRVFGSCLKGEQCSPLKPTGAKLNNMPICCSKASDRLSLTKLNNRGQTLYLCGCSAPKGSSTQWNGNCWQGSQCDSCDPGYVGSANGKKLCCANCQKKGLNINAGTSTCNCNN